MSDWLNFSGVWKRERNAKQIFVRQKDALISLTNSDVGNHLAFGSCAKVTSFYNLLNFSCSFVYLVAWIFVYVGKKENGMFVFSLACQCCGVINLIRYAEVALRFLDQLLNQANFLSIHLWLGFINICRRGRGCLLLTTNVFKSFCINDKLTHHMTIIR